MSDYLDASALVAVLLDESASPAVRRLLMSGPEPIVSSFCLGECSAAIAGLVTMGRKSRAQADALLEALDDWIATSAVMVEIHEADIADATLLVRSFDLKLRLPDAIHVAMAQRMEARLVTLDHRMLDAARVLGVSCINPAAPTPSAPAN